MHRWFTAHYTTNVIPGIMLCELFARQSNDTWKVSADIDGGNTFTTHPNLWIAIGNLFDANNAVCLRMREIDRAGNPV